MSSIVLELQKNSLESNIPISELLRKSLLVATKLGQQEFTRWLDYETNGYPMSDNLSVYPLYRKIRGTPQVQNPFYGYQQITFASQDLLQLFSTRYCHTSTPELEHMLKSDTSASKGGRFEINYDPETSMQLMKAMNIDLHPTLLIQASSIAQILNSVRNTIMNWTLQLEKDGILGEGLSFSEQDKEKVTSNTYNVSNFYGNLSNLQMQQGTERSQQEVRTFS